ncbi:MAG: ABC transporter ATP-binding protein [Lachnospiraceae bacterium]|nr:ABC transporter ATP-binding protein [Lachnospiraceae bacterium]
MGKLLKYMTWRQWLYVLGVVFFVVVSVWCTLTMPDYMTKVTQLVETGGAVSEVWKYGGIMLACAVGDLCCAILVGLFTAQVASRFAASLRDNMYRKVVSFSMEEYSSFSTSSLLTRATNDVQQVTMVIGMGLQAFLKAPIIAVWAFVKILGKGQTWLMITGIAIVILICVIGSNLILVIPKFKKIQKLTDNLNRVARENLTGVRVVRAYNAEEYQSEKYDGANTALMKNHLFTGRIMAYLFPSIQAVMSGTSLAIYWAGAFIIQNTAGAGAKIAVFSELVTFMAYAVQIIMAFMMISMIFILLPRAMVSADRINQILDKETKIHDGSHAAEGESKGTVEFRDVAFSYPDAEEPVLSGISFEASKGDVVAFIGSTGSGKSTLVNLVPRFYDVTEGQVLVDGVDVKEYTQHDLREKIGYVSQKAILFKGTLASNVAYGADDGASPSEEKVKRAMEIAQGHDILAKTEQGIYQEVAQGGSNFSGGQKQRISIARAIYKNPEIFIFDDSFSALDYKTDKVLRATLKKETKDATTLIVAQRIGTVKDADQIIVLDEGKMVGKGKHADLLKDCEVYRQIAYSQLSEEELKNA